MSRPTHSGLSLQVEPLEDRFLLSTVLIARVDLDGDGNNELVYVDSERLAGTHATDEDDDNPDEAPKQDEDKDVDVVVLGGLDTELGVCGLSKEVDEDEKDTELLIKNPNLITGYAAHIDVDKDGDSDILIIGTRR